MYTSVRAVLADFAQADALCYLTFEVLTALAGSYGSSDPRVLVTVRARRRPLAAYTVGR